MNTLLIHQEQEQTSFSRLLIKGSLISIFAFLLLISGLVLQPDMLQHQQETQTLSRGLLQASFTAITRLPIEARKPSYPADCSSDRQASIGERETDLFTSSCKKISLQLWALY